jgi:hypothetical protein
VVSSQEVRVLDAGLQGDLGDLYRARAAAVTPPERRPPWSERCAAQLFRLTRGLTGRTEIPVVASDT